MLDCLVAKIIVIMRNFQRRIQTAWKHHNSERLCERTSSEWSTAQLKDETSTIVVEFILARVSVGIVAEEVLSCPTQQ